MIASSYNICIISSTICYQLSNCEMETKKIVIKRHSVEDYFIIFYTSRQLTSNYLKY